MKTFGAMRFAYCTLPLRCAAACCGKDSYAKHVMSQPQTGVAFFLATQEEVTCCLTPGGVDLFYSK